MTIRRADRLSGVALTGLVSDPIVFDEVAIRARAEHRTAGSNTLEVSIGDLVREASPDPSATHLSAISGDGLYSASIPLDQAAENGVLLVGAGESMPRDMGGPFRLTVVDGDTLCWNVKNVAELRLTSGSEPDSVPENPGH